MTARFQLDSFEQLLAGADDATLRIAGRWTVSAGGTVPRAAMLVDDGTKTYRLVATNVDTGDGLSGSTEIHWRAEFQAPRAVVEADRVAFALECPEAGIVDLPRPGGALIESFGKPTPTPAAEPTPVQDDPLTQLPSSLIRPIGEPAEQPHETPAEPQIAPFTPERIAPDAAPAATSSGGIPTRPIPAPAPPPPVTHGAATGRPDSQLLESLADIQNALAQAERQTSEIVALRETLGLAERERDRTRSIADEALRRADAAERALESARAQLAMQERDLRLAQTAAEQGDRVSESLRAERAARRQAEAELERQQREHAQAIAQRHSDLSTEVQSLRQRYEQELAERRTAESRAHEAETELAAIRVAAEEAGARAARAEAELEGLTGAQRRLEESERKLAEAQSIAGRAGALEAELADQRSEVTLLRERLADVQTARAAEVQALRAALVDAEHAATESEARRLRECQALEARLAEVQERATRDAAAAELARSERDELHASTNRRIRDAESEAGTLRAWLAAAEQRSQEESQRLQAELEALRRSESAVRSELQTAHALSAPGAAEEIENLRRDAEELRGLLAGADMRLAEQAQQFHTDLQRVREEAERQAEALRERLAAAELGAGQAAPDETPAQLAELTTQLEAARLSVADAQRERDALAVQLSETEDRLAAQSADSEQHGELVGSLQARIEELQAEQRDAERELSDLRAQAAAPPEIDAGEIEALRQQADAGRQAAGELEGLRSMYAAVNEAHERVSAREQELTQQLGDLDEIRRERDAAQRQIDELKATLESRPQTSPPDLSDEISSLRAELDGARAQLAAAERARATAEAADQSPPPLTVIEGEGQGSDEPQLQHGLAAAAAPHPEISADEASRRLDEIRRERRMITAIIVVALAVTALIIAGALTDVLGV